MLRKAEEPNLYRGRKGGYPPTQQGVGLLKTDGETKLLSTGRPVGPVFSARKSRGKSHSNRDPANSSSIPKSQSNKIDEI